MPSDLLHSAQYRFSTVSSHLLTTKMSLGSSLILQRGMRSPSFAFIQTILSCHLTMRRLPLDICCDTGLRKPAPPLQHETSHAKRLHEDGAKQQNKQKPQKAHLRSQKLARRPRNKSEQEGRHSTFAHTSCMHSVTMWRRCDVLAPLTIITPKLCVSNS